MQSSQCFAGESWKDERCAVDVSIVVFAKLLFLFWTPLSHRLFQVAVGILAADHEADLTGRICRYGRVCIFDVREHLATIFLDLGNQRHVKPLVFG